MKNVLFFAAGSVTPNTRLSEQNATVLTALSCRLFLGKIKVCFADYPDAEKTAQSLAARLAVSPAIKAPVLGEAPDKAALIERVLPFMLHSKNHAETMILVVGHQEMVSLPKGIISRLYQIDPEIDCNQSQYIRIILGDEEPEIHVIDI